MSIQKSTRVINEQFIDFSWGDTWVTGTQPCSPPLLGSLWTQMFMESQWDVLPCLFLMVYTTWVGQYLWWLCLHILIAVDTPLSKYTAAHC